MREIALDTETTGLDPYQGHRVIEIGCVEMNNRVRTGEVFHAYVNPERDIPEAAFNVHGLSEEFLKDMPYFQNVAKDFLSFIGDSPLVIHNANFDLKFLNAELEKIARVPIAYERAVDTLLIARKKFPGAPASLDALCRRFDIDLSVREKHGALLDAELLADVYLELMGGSQEALDLSRKNKEKKAISEQVEKIVMETREHSASEEEEKEHKEFLENKVKESIWNN